MSVKAAVTVHANEVEIRFTEAPAPAVRQVLKTWRFRFDGAAWRRDAGFTIGRLIDDLDRLTSVEWTYFIVDRYGVRRPARVERAPARTPKLVVDETQEEETREPEPEPAAARELRAARCLECGTLTALEPGDQPELDRRQREAVEQAIAAAKLAGLPPYLSAAPVPHGVKVVRRHVCRVCAREAW
ncbi:MAG: hypothetical protein NZ761_12405 [Dehalococcoidia bacterium]|nr:hypothetical protein [Dehalococcoidia bacterium]